MDWFHIVTNFNDAMLVLDGRISDISFIKKFVTSEITRLERSSLILRDVEMVKIKKRKKFVNF